MPGPEALMRHPAVSAAVGAGAIAADGALTLYHGAVRLPVVGSWLDRQIGGLVRRGETVVTENIAPVRSALGAIVVRIVEAVLEELDLTELVRTRVDIDAIVQDIDIDAIINRIDLITLADKVIDGVDLPAIIRESTSSVTAEVMTDVRGQGQRADDLVSGIVDRMLGRRDVGMS